MKKNLIKKQNKNLLFEYYEKFKKQINELGYFEFHGNYVDQITIVHKDDEEWNLVIYFNDDNEIKTKLSQRSKWNGRLLCEKKVVLEAK